MKRAGSRIEPLHFSTGFHTKVRVSLAPRTASRPALRYLGPSPVLAPLTRVPSRVRYTPTAKACELRLTLRASLGPTGFLKAEKDSALRDIKTTFLRSCYEKSFLFANDLTSLQPICFFSAPAPKKNSPRLSHCDDVPSPSRAFHSLHSFNHQRYEPFILMLWLPP